MDHFIVFMAIVLIFTAFFAFGDDIRRCEMLSKRLKVLSEECAHYAALCVDEDMSRMLGWVVIDEAAAQQAAERLCQSSDIPRLFPETISLEVKITVSSAGSAEAELHWKGKDLLRLPAIKKTQAVSKSAYAWE